MSSLQALREFISERLTAAAGEIFTVFEHTVLQYEEQIARQHKLLEISWNPRVKLHRTESPQQHIGNQKTSSGLEQEEHEAPHIKEEEDFDEETVTDGESKESPDSVGDLTAQRLTAAAELPLHHDGTEEQLFKQKTHSRLEQGKTEPQPITGEQEEPGPSQLEEPEELGAGQEGESDCFRVPSIEEQIYPSEPEEVPDTEQFLPRDSEVRHQLVHMKAHTVESPYSCQRCGKSFYKQSYLLRHVRTRTCEQSYSCDTCGKNFEKQSYLMRHVRSHTGEKPYSCVTCGKGFSQHNHMLVHTRTHTGEKPYSCETCGRSFSDHSSLLRHTKTHTGERPYTCEICGKSFNRQNHLLVHIRIHTGEKPYSCETCGKSFTHRNSLQHHMKSHK